MWWQIRLPNGTTGWTAEGGAAIYYWYPNGWDVSAVPTLSVATSVPTEVVPAEEQPTASPQAGNEYTVLSIAVNFSQGFSYTFLYEPATYTILNGAEFVLHEILRVKYEALGDAYGRPIVLVFQYAKPVVGEADSVRRQIEYALCDNQRDCSTKLRYKVGTRYMDSSGVGNVVFGYFCGAFNIPVRLEDVTSDVAQVVSSSVASIANFDWRVVLTDFPDDISQRRAGRYLYESGPTVITLQALLNAAQSANLS